MNIAGLGPSESAPVTWSQDLQQEALFSELFPVSSDNASNAYPDIIALQECPSPEWASGIVDRGGVTYQLVGESCTRSHAGFVCLLVKRSSEFSSTSLAVPDTPMVATVLSWGAGHKIAIASVHLEPFSDGKTVRIEQVQTLIKSVSSSDLDALIFMGDTNMRDSEDTNMEHELGLMDAWKQAGSSEESRYSWDTMPHGTVGENGFSQNLYYGDGTRAYRRRYDRIYLSGLRQSKSKSSTQKSAALFHPEVSQFYLIANKPIAPSQTQFLSDHFGLTAELELAWMQ